MSKRCILIIKIHNNYLLKYIRTLVEDELEISDNNYSLIEKGEEIGAIGKTNAMNPIEQDKNKLKGIPV